jgi:hypothetical protein
MKNKFYILSLICIMMVTSEKSFSQNYLSLFGDTSTTWDLILFGYCDGMCSQTFTVDNDTTINTKTYKIIPGIPGFLREDSILGKAWFFDTYSNMEYLVMDLSLNLGDTFNLYDFSSVAYPYIVDSVFYVNGKKHVRINAWSSLCGPYEQITFIEGSGTTAGFTYQRYLSGSSVPSYMLCHNKDGIKENGNILFMDTCSVCSVGNEELNSDLTLVKVFPNPTFDELNIVIKNTSSNTFWLSIYNLLGEQIIYQQISNSTNINVLSLNKGVYFAVISDNNNNFYQKIIKQ